MQRIYKNKFYENRDKETRASANKILNILSEFCQIKSVCDVGCGVGTWLSAADEIFTLGGGAVKGFDGDYVNRNLLQISNENFITVDLEKKLKYSNRFDLVICLEVAEHLSPGRAETFVDDLINLGDLILFGAAIPHQGGVGHINEQPLSFWRDKFDRRQYRMLDIIRPRVWNDKGVLAHYKQNTVVFVKENSKVMDSFEQMTTEPIIDIVSPDMWMYMYNMYVKEAQKGIIRKIVYNLRKRFGKWKM